MKKHLILFSIILIGFWLRVINLSSLPVILNRDEAALGYNALLLKETGKDEWGRVWPLTLESFGDFKLPGYPFLLVILFSLLPPADWVVRIPSALAGTGLIYLAYRWGQKLFHHDTYPFWAAVLVALTPVFFFYSRIAFEANVALTLMVMALYFLLIAKPTKKHDVIGMLSWSAASLTYNTPFILLPVLILSLILRRGWVHWRRWLFPVSCLVLIFFILSFIFIPLTSQKKGITVFTDETIWNNYIQYRTAIPDNWQKILGNRWVYNFELMGERLARTFSLQFLVKNGGSHPWHSMPGYGHVYWLSYILGWLGLMIPLQHFLPFLKHVFKNHRLSINLKKPLSLDLTLVFWLFLSLLPSIITVDSPHATRSLLFLFIFVMLGIRNWELVSVNLASLVKTKTKKAGKIDKIVLVLFNLIFLTWIVIEGSQYLVKYFYIYPLHQPSSLKVGLKEVIREVESTYPNAQIAYVDSQGYDYILVAWYARVSPTNFFLTINKQLPDKIGFRYGDRLTRYHFVAQASDRIDQETVLIDWDGKNWSINHY